jgi:tRNA threonylcarbamoyl adenosine modification protein YeaZ
MHSYIAIQNTYEIFEIALFVNNKLVSKKREDKHDTSKLFIPLLDELLTQNNAKISDFDFCAVNCGPGPFSTLRSIIASVNGLHFATNIPLISIDGLEATFFEFYNPTYQHTIVLLNAFNNEVYYLIAHRDQILTKGYQKIDTFLNSVRNASTGSARTDEKSAFYNNSNPNRARPAVSDDLSFVALAKEEAKSEAVEGNERLIHFLGNGVSLHQSLIKETFGNNAVIQETNPSMCSIEMIGKIGLEKWLLKQGANSYVMPLHLKKHAVEL